MGDDTTLQGRAKASLNALMDILNGRAPADALSEAISQATWVLASVANERPDDRIATLEARIAELEAGGCPHVAPGVTRYCREAADARRKALEEAAILAEWGRDPLDIAEAIRALKDKQP
jgi:hypothetical protein